LSCLLALLPALRLLAVDLTPSSVPPTQFTIETSALKSSELGKVVYFYTKCKRVDPAVARIASQLVGEWMRPILRRSKAFVDRDLAQGRARYGASSHEAAKAAGRGQGGAEDAAQATRHARIPQVRTSLLVSLSPSLPSRPCSCPLLLCFLIEANVSLTLLSCTRPQALTATYAVAPGSRVTGQSTTLPGQGSGAKMRGFKQKMQMAQQAARRG